MKWNWKSFLSSALFFLIGVAGVVLADQWPLKLVFVVVVLIHYPWLAGDSYIEMARDRLRIRGLLWKDIPYQNIRDVGPMTERTGGLWNLLPKANPAQMKGTVTVELVKPIWMFPPIPLRSNSLGLAFEDETDVQFIRAMRERLRN